MSDDINIRLSITRAYPELQAEMNDIPPRERAERMRLLATIGLMVSQGRAMLLASGSVVDVSGVSSESSSLGPSDSAKKKNLARRVLKSAGDLTS